MAVLIKNGLVYDGSGEAPVKNDILIHKDVIARVGAHVKSDQHEVFDASDCIVLPGFIDSDARSDHRLTLISDPFQKHYIREGITTILLGNEGVSRAPLLHNPVHSGEYSGSNHDAHIGWRHVRDFLTFFKSRGTGINFGTLVGYDTLRAAFTKGVLRDLTDGELDACIREVYAALHDGAFGVSFNFRPMKGGGLSHHEFRSILKALSKKRAVCAVSSSYEGAALKGFVEDVLRIAHDFGTSIEFNHLEPALGDAEYYKEIIELIEKASAQNHVMFDVSPSGMSVRPLSRFLPNLMQHEIRERMQEIISDAHTHTQLTKYLETFKEADPVILRISDTSLKFLEGKRVAAFAENQNMSFAEGFLKLLRITKLRALIAYHNRDTDLLDRYMASPAAIIASHGLQGEYEGVHCSPLKFLKMTAEQHIIPLEKAVTKITSLPAKKYGVEKRGVVRRGAYADIAVVNADYELQAVFVNGKKVFEGGSVKGIKAGKALRRVS